MRPTPLPFVLLAVLAAATAGCLRVQQDPGDWGTASCPAPGGEPSDLVVLHEGLLVRLAWRDGEYVESARRLLPEERTHEAGKAEATPDPRRLHAPAEQGPRLVGGEEGLYLVRGGTVERLGADLRPAANADVGPWTAVAAGGGVFLSVNVTNVTVRDADLRPVSAVDVAIRGHDGWPKPVDHALVHAGRAYLLDNVVLPALVALVDLRGPAPAVVAVQDASSVNGHLTGQWVDGDAWVVLSSGGVMTGSYQSARVFDATTGEDAARHGLWDRSYGPVEGGRRGGTASGYQIRAHTDDTPVWAVVSAGGEGAPQFAHVQVDASGLRVGCAQDLPHPSDGEPSHVVRAGGAVVVTVEGGLRVHALDGTLLDTLALDGPVRGLAAAP